MTLNWATGAITDGFVHVAIFGAGIQQVRPAGPLSWGRLVQRAPIESDWIQKVPRSTGLGQIKPLCVKRDPISLGQGGVLFNKTARHSLRVFVPSSAGNRALNAFGSFARRAR